MNGLLSFFAGEWGALRFLAGFVIVPLLYLRDRAEVHQEYAAHGKALSENSDGLTQERLEALRSRLHVFELEWWLIAAATVLFTGVFFMGSVARLSQQLDDRSRHGITSPAGALASVEPIQETDPCEQVEGLLNAFGFALALTAMFCVRWAKAEAYRELQKDWFTLAGTRIADVQKDGP